MTIGGYIFILVLVVLLGVYLYARKKYKKDKPKEILKEYKKDKK